MTRDFPVPHEITHWRSRNWITSVVLVLCGTILFSWPTVINRQPFLLSDTTTYIRGADAAVFRTTGVQSQWTQRYFDRFGATRGQHDAARTTAAPQARAKPIVLAGRSIYYGAFLYTADRLAGLRLASFLQALIAATAVLGTVIRFSPGRRKVVVHFLLLACVLSGASTLAYFAGYLVPDIFTGLGILAAAHLITSAPKLSRPWKVFWFVIACGSGLTHESNVLILSILPVIMLLVRLRDRRRSFASLAVIGCALAISIAGEGLFYAGVQHLTGDPPIRPPFLAARLIADGPGATFLRKTCPASGYDLCRHADQLSNHSDQFLWSQGRHDGVFSVVTSDEQRRIAAEENRFVLDVLTHYPGQVIEGLSLDVARQLGKWTLIEFNVNSYQRSEFAQKLPPSAMHDQAESLAFQGRMPVKVVELLNLAVALLSIGVVSFALIRGSCDLSTRLFVAALLTGFAADIVVCGALSTPHDRYLMRAAWLLPLAAFLCLRRKQLGGRSGRWTPKLRD